jgi:hypothetical protein
LHILGIPLDPDAAQTSDYAHAGTDPVKLIDKNISCRDKRSGLVVDYLVIDYMKSAVGGGEYFLLENQQGQRKNVTADELWEIRVA